MHDRLARGRSFALEFVDARRRYNAVDESACAGGPPELAMVDEDVDMERASEWLKSAADAPPMRKIAPVAAWGTFKDNASRHGVETGEPTVRGGQRWLCFET